MIEQFHRPGSVREAVALKRRLRARAAFIAGGTWLNALECKDAPAEFISLEGLGLDRIATRDGRIEIGATATLQRLLEDRRVPAPLQAAIAQIVTPNIRNIATIGGHVVHHSPVSDVIPMLLAMDATLVFAGSARRVPLAAWLAKPTAGLLTTIVLPKPAAARRFAVRNLRESAHADSVVSVAVAYGLARGALEHVRIAASGIGRASARLAAAEKALEGSPLPGLDAIESLVRKPLKPVPSVHASVALRRQATAAAVALALHAASPKGGRA